jgi:putative transposase
MREWFTSAEILPAAQPPLPDSAAALNAYIVAQGWQNDMSRARVRFDRGGGYEYHIALFPAATRSLLLAVDETPIQEAVEQASNPDRSALWDGFDRLSDEAKGRAAQRLAAVHAVHAAEVGVTRQSAVKTVCKSQGVSPSSLWQWLGKIAGADAADWLPRLADQRKPEVSKDRAAINPDAWDYFVADYLRLEQPGLAACYDRLIRAAKVHGWGELPSCKTLSRRIKQEVSAGVLTLARKGREAAAVMAPAQRRDRTVFASLEAVNADGYRHNVFVQWPDGSIGRPISIAFQDIRSGLWLARRTDKSENKEATRLAVGDMVSRYGIPEHVYFDNGRHFSSKWLTGRMPFRFRFKIKDEEPEGILKTLGMKVHFTKPYSGRSKPIERSFRQMGEYIDKHPAFAGANTGNTPMNKPANYGSAAVPLALFEQFCASEVLAHNAREGRAGFGMNGRSFDQVFKDHAPELGFRKCSIEQRRLFLLAAEGVTARKPDGHIELFENRFWDEALTEQIGKLLIVRFDPQNLHSGLAVYSLDNRFLCEAARLDDVGFKSADDARETARLHTQLQRSRKEALELARRLEVADLKRLSPIDLTDAPDNEPQKIVRLAVASGGRRASAQALDFDALGSALERIQQSGGVTPFRTRDGA